MTKEEVFNRLDIALSGCDYTLTELVEFIELKCKFHDEGLNDDEYEEYDNKRDIFESILPFRKNK